MADRHVRDTVNALRRHSTRVARHHTVQPQLAIVRHEDPVVAELIEGRHLLDDDDLVFTEASAAVDLSRGDSLVLLPYRHGDWVVIGVLSDHDDPKPHSTWQDLQVEDEITFTNGSLYRKSNGVIALDTKIMQPPGAPSLTQYPNIDAPDASGGTLDANTYFYCVTALNDDGETGPSGVSSIVVTGSNKRVVVNWGNVTHATSYKVYRSTSATLSTMRRIAVTTNSALNDTGLHRTGDEPPASTDIGGVQIGDANDRIGFYGASPKTKPTITGSRDGNAALADLLTALDSRGIINDSTTA